LGAPVLIRYGPFAFLLSDHSYLSILALFPLHYGLAISTTLPSCQLPQLPTWMHARCACRACLRARARPDISFSDGHFFWSRTTRQILWWPILVVYIQTQPRLSTSTRCFTGTATAFLGTRSPRPPTTTSTHKHDERAARTKLGGFTNVAYSMAMSLLYASWQTPDDILCEQVPPRSFDVP